MPLSTRLTDWLTESRKTDGHIARARAFENTLDHRHHCCYIVCIQDGYVAAAHFSVVASACFCLLHVMIQLNVTYNTVSSTCPLYFENLFYLSLPFLLFVCFGPCAWVEQHFFFALSMYSIVSSLLLSWLLKRPSRLSLSSSCRSIMFLSCETTITRAFRVCVRTYARAYVCFWLLASCIWLFVRLFCSLLLFFLGGGVSREKEADDSTLSWQRRHCTLLRSPRRWKWQNIQQSVVYARTAKKNSYL